MRHVRVNIILHEEPCTDPYARFCERTAGNLPASYSIQRKKLYHTLVSYFTGVYYYVMEYWIYALSSELFWDVSRESVDPERHGRWLVERVLHRGSWEDWLLIRSHYSKSRLLDLSPTLNLGPKSAHFLKLYCSL